MTSAPSIEFRTLVSETVAMMRRNWVLVAAYIAITGLVDALTRNAGDEGGGLLLSMMAEAVVGYVLLVKIMTRERLRTVSSMRAGVTAYVGVSILAGLGILAGLVLVVVPGLILMARWFVAIPIALNGTHSTSMAMGESWRATRGSQGALSGFCAVTILAIVSVAGAGQVLIAVSEGSAGTSISAVNLTDIILTQVITAIMTVAPVAGFRTLVTSSGTLTDVFA